MCGICGIIGKEKQQGIRYVDAMLANSYHRGPDSEGKYSDEKACLGVRRLSIIDLDTGQQPFFSEDKKLIMIFNGEIYNYLSIKQKLSACGHEFRTGTDAEIIIHLYQEYGRECLDMIKGMFSFAIWNRDQKSLFIARDRFGIKPLYYYYNNGVFCFSSELRTLLCLPFITKEINRKALGLYFSLEYVPSPYSIIEGIEKLRPAHYIFLEHGRLENKCYWDLNVKKDVFNLSFNEVKDKTYFLLKQSVKQHLISDVPLGVFLSGGIDSTALAYMAREESADKIASFTIGFEENTFDESGYARMVARDLGLDHYNYTFTANEFIKVYGEAEKLLDEPFADISIFPSYMLSKMSGKNIKVALSGEGADELFMGYPTYQAHKYYDYINVLPDIFKKAFSKFLDILPASFKYLTLDFKLRKFFEGINENDPLKRHLQWMGTFSPIDLCGIFSENQGIDLDVLGEYLNNVLSVPKTFERAKRIQHLDIFSYLSEDLLVKADRSSMAASLELRVPYLDHELVEFIWSVPPKFLYRKKLMRNIFNAKIPNYIINRKKKGFAIPFSIWLSDKRFLEMIMPYFEKDYLKKQGLFDQKYVKNMLEEHLCHRRNNRKRLRTYIMFQRWYESVFYKK